MRDIFGHRMKPNPSQSQVNLPSRTRGQVVSAIRAGARDAEDLEEHLAKQERKAPPVGFRHPAGKPELGHVMRTRDGIETIEIARSEHKLLIEIAVLCEAFWPRLELSGTAVQRPREYEMLRTRLETFRRLLSGQNTTAASTQAILSLLATERLLAD